RRASPRMPRMVLILTWPFSSFWSCQTHPNVAEVREAQTPRWFQSLIGRAQTCWRDRKSTRLNSSHVKISYAVFCLKKKKKVYLYVHHKKFLDPNIPNAK